MAASRTRTARPANSRAVPRRSPERQFTDDEVEQRAQALLGGPERGGDAS